MYNLQIIREIAQRKGIKLKHLAEQSGISEQGLQLLLKTGRTRIETLKKIADVLGVELSELTGDVGIMNEPVIKYRRSDNVAQSADKCEFLLKVMQDQSEYIEMLKSEIERLKRLCKENTKS